MISLGDALIPDTNNLLFGTKDKKDIKGIVQEKNSQSGTIYIRVLCNSPNIGHIGCAKWKFSSQYVMSLSF